MTSGYHGSKTAVCIVERWKKSMGYRSVSEVQSWTGKTRVNFFVFLPYLQDHGLLTSINFATMATWRNNFSSLLLVRVTQLFSSILYFSEKSRRGNNSSVQSKANWEKNDKSLRVRDATMMNTKYACAPGCWKDAHGRSRSGKLKFLLFTWWNKTKDGFGSNFADFISLRSSRSCSMMVWIFRNSV